MLREKLIAGRFALEELLGSGGMGEVYAARDGETGERVALKLLRAEGPLAAARFQREGALLAQLAHPGIVRFVAAGTTADDQRYLAMEWLDGEDLAARLDRGPLALREAVALIADVGRALAVLHDKGIVHRDVKPSNVFLVLGDVTRPKLLDFGIARPMPSNDRVTKTGAGIGTIGYMAPEQVRGDGALDARCDVFALGCVLFECITGRPPFAGEHALAILTRIVLEPAPTPSDFRPGVPPALDDLVARMLARDREDRPRDAADVVASLARIDGLPPGEPGESVDPAEKSSVQALAASRRRMVMAILGDEAPGEETLSPEDMEQLQRSLDRVAPATRGSPSTSFGVASTRPLTSPTRSASRWAIVVGLGMAAGSLAAVIAFGNSSSDPPKAALPAGAAALVAEPASSPSLAASATAAPTATQPAPVGSAAASTSAAPRTTVAVPPPRKAPLPPRPANTPCSGLDCL